MNTSELCRARGPSASSAVRQPSCVMDGTPLSESPAPPRYTPVAPGRDLLIPSPGKVESEKRKVYTTLHAESYFPTSTFKKNMCARQLRPQAGEVEPGVARHPVASSLSCRCVIDSCSVHCTCVGESVSLKVGLSDAGRRAVALWRPPSTPAPPVHLSIAAVKCPPDSQSPNNAAYPWRSPRSGLGGLRAPSPSPRCRPTNPPLPQ